MCIVMMVAWHMSILDMNNVLSFFKKKILCIRKRKRKRNWLCLCSSSYSLLLPFELPLPFLVLSHSLSSSSSSHCLSLYCCLHLMRFMAWFLFLVEFMAPFVFPRLRILFSSSLTLTFYDAKWKNIRKTTSTKQRKILPNRVTIPKTLILNFITPYFF
jgi:hypothetical protein